MNLQNLHISNAQNPAKEKLMSLIPFDEADLGMNDDGFFSPDQQQRLKPRTDLYIAMSIIGTILSFTFAMIFFLIGQNEESFKIAITLSLIVFGLFFYLIFWSLGIAHRIKRGYGVKKVEGNAELLISHTGNDEEIAIYHLQIQNVRFRINEGIFLAFESGKAYRVYYFRLVRNEILSVDVVN